MLAGSVFSFVLSDSINYPISIAGRMTKMQRTEYADLGVKGPVLAGIFAILMFAMFVYMAPLTYGTPGYVVRAISSFLVADPISAALTVRV